MGIALLLRGTRRHIALLPSCPPAHPATLPTLEPLCHHALLPSCPPSSHRARPRATVPPCHCATVPPCHCAPVELADADVTVL